jgi:nanoRNase/pAp phosphatase (c-di-AMP/oligoRNAs hydrolase)
MINMTNNYSYATHAPSFFQKLSFLKEEGVEKKPDIAVLLEKHRGEKHLVILHEFPDPDAISSAFAHKLISAEYNIDVDITYTGKISHSQNIALVKLLGIELLPYDSNMDLHQYQGAVFLDNQGTTVNGIVKLLQAANVPVLIVVDHHEPQDILSPEYSDIQKTGSTATIYTDYIEHGLLEMQKSHKEHVAMATALMHGILTDTVGFIRADMEDFNAAAFLSQFRDAELLERIMNQSHTKQVMDIIRRALENRTLVENLSIAGIGYLRSEDRDAIPQAAEFLMKEENVHTAIVYGIIKNQNQDEFLTGSLRTSKFNFDPDDFIKGVFGVSPEGRYYGGGKHMAGGFSIPVGFLTGEPSEDYADMKWQVFDTQVKAKIFAKIGVKNDLFHALPKNSQIKA